MMVEELTCPFQVRDRPDRKFDVAHITAAFHLPRRDGAGRNSPRSVARRTISRIAATLRPRCSCGVRWQVLNPAAHR
jgi:hypothetical protein